MHALDRECEVARKMRRRARLNFWSRVEFHSCCCARVRSAPRAIMICLVIMQITFSVCLPFKLDHAMQINLQFRVALLKVVGCAAPLTCDSNFCLLRYMRGSLSAHTTRRRRLVESEFAHAQVDRYPKIVITVTMYEWEPSPRRERRNEANPRKLSGFIDGIGTFYSLHWNYCICVNANLFFLAMLLLSHGFYSIVGFRIDFAKYA